MPRYWLGLDQGSTATKACLVDRRGRVRRIVSAGVPIRRPSPGWAEHDGESLFRSARSVLDRVLRGIDPASVRALGITSQRSTFLFWEPGSGRPLTPALSWQDRRAEELCRVLSRHEATIRRKTGLRLSPHYAASKIRWLLDRSPALRKRAERGGALFGTLDSYLLFRLTGGASWSTDPTHAARTLLMDLRRMDWDKEILEIFRVPARALPPIRPSAFPAGEIGIRGVFVPVAATLGDQQAALLGLGCRKEAEMAINYGTGAFVVLNTGSRPRRVPGLLTSVAWSSAREMRYLLEGSINSAGSALDWIRTLTKARAPSGGIVTDLHRLPLMVPSFSGLAAPHWVSGARGALLDLDLATGGEDLAAAALAGVACRVQEIVEAMGKRGLRPRRIVAGGGLVQSRSLLPIQASMLGRPIESSRTPEGTARGAALLAGHSRGDWDLEESPFSQGRGEVIRPSMNRAEVDRYCRRFRRAVSFIASRAEST